MLHNRKVYMPLFQRTIKLTLATCLAAFLASFWGASYATTAGIIALLSVSETRRSTLKLAYKRLLSMLLALALASLSFAVFGFQLWSLSLYLLIYIPLAYQLGWEIGITPSTVLVTHLLLEESIALPLLANEVLIFLIGTLIALSVNLYMPDRQNKLTDYHTRVENLLRSILKRFETFLRLGDGRNDAELIKKLDQELEEAMELAFLDQSDQLLHQTTYHVAYFEMRREQNYILKAMAQNINHCQFSVEESTILADLFAYVAEELSQENPAQDLLDKIQHYLAIFRQRPLPQTREEFESRATLLQLLRDLYVFVQIKVDFAQHHAQSSQKA